MTPPPSVYIYQPSSLPSLSDTLSCTPCATFFFCNCFVKYDSHNTNTIYKINQKYKLQHEQLFVLTTFWPHLWSISEENHRNIESMLNKNEWLMYIFIFFLFFFCKPSLQSFHFCPSFSPVLIPLLISSKQNALPLPSQLASLSFLNFYFIDMCWWCRWASCLLLISTDKLLTTAVTLWTLQGRYL